MITSSLFAQKDYWSVGANADYYIPMSALGERFKPTLGGSISLGKTTEKNWYWFGQAEYFNMEKGNEDNFKILRNVEVNGSDVPFTLPIDNIVVKFEVGSLSANTEYTMIKTDQFETSAKLGFGIYRWFYSRSGVSDTLYADTTGAGDLVQAAVLNVPAVSQTDWSGGFNAGIAFQIKIYEPVWFYANADYKVIIGEIFPALDLGLENISTFQMLNIKAGIRVRI